MEWQYATPKEYYKKLTKLIGQPSILSLKEGGLALWLKTDLDKVNFFGIPNCFEEILLRDEAIQHRCPAKHTDFLYSYVYVDIGPDILPIIHSISGSVSYDPLKKLLSARCGSIEANVATLKLCTDILTDKLDTNDYYNIAPLYGSLIKSTKDPEIARELYQSLYDNLQELGRPAISDYWIGAFDADCNESPKQFQWDAVCEKADKLKKPNQNGARKDKADKADKWQWGGVPLFKKIKKAIKIPINITDKADKPYIDIPKAQKGARYDKLDKPQSGARHDKLDKPQSGARHDKLDKPQSGARHNKLDKPQSGARHDKLDKPQSGARYDKLDKPQSGARHDKLDKPQSGARHDKLDKPQSGARHDKLDKPQKGKGRLYSASPEVIRKSTKKLSSASPEVIRKSTKRLSSASPETIRKRTAVPRGRLEENNPFKSLTTDERKILVLLSKGKTIKQISSELFFGRTEIYNIINNIVSKLGLKNRNDAIAYAINYHLEYYL